MFMNAVTSTLQRKWTFRKPDFRWFPNTKANKIKGKLNSIAWKNKGTQFTFFQSLYVDDAVFILLSRSDAINAMKLLTTHFRRFGLTVHTGSISKKESSKTEFVHIPAPDHITSLEDLSLIHISEPTRPY